MSETPPMPSAQIVSEAGLAQVAPYTARLFSATKQAAVLMISSLTGQEAITITRMGDLVMFHLIAVWEPGSAQEKAAWQCFARLGVSAEEKQQPVGFAFVGLFRDHREKMQVRRGELEAGFLTGFPHGAFERRLSRAGFQLAADGTPDAQVGRLGTQEQQLFAGGILEENQHGNLVGEGRGHTVAIGRRKLVRAGAGL